ncbi:hypothetical protein COCON_G00054860 [Conger conger]|uniref:Par3/HAL N-terminal domain-containing protein n=1 Tax=Conger conger TaxID=82655 RepID=A0A9Q1DWB5_CONCO|nr:hypothetical protein COCON_G00054860 [Conger conger]
MLGDGEPLSVRRVNAGAVGVVGLPRRRSPCGDRATEPCQIPRPAERLRPGALGVTRAPPAGEIGEIGPRGLSAVSQARPGRHVRSFGEREPGRLAGLSFSRKEAIGAVSSGHGAHAPRYRVAVFTRPRVPYPLTPAVRNRQRCHTICRLEGDFQVRTHHVEYCDGGILDPDDVLTDLVEDKDKRPERKRRRSSSSVGRVAPSDHTEGAERELFMRDALPDILRVIGREPHLCVRL